VTMLDARLAAESFEQPAASASGIASWSIQCNGRQAQVTRSPGKKVVYVGCLLLVLGIFSMFYIRERRIWVWVKPTTDGGAHALMAMSTQRRTLDFEREYEDLKNKLPQSA